MVRQYIDTAMHHMGHASPHGSADILKVLEEEGYRTIALSPQETEYGAIESLKDARKCADLFKKHRDEIDGVLVTLPNFGDERAIANALRWSGLDVPVLIQAFPDDVQQMTIADRRDSFCGKMSACNNLSQYGIKFSLTSLHTVDPESESFRSDLSRFASTCRVVRGLKSARVGAIGARPAAFNTVRYSEKLLERSGITVETLDLSEVFGRAARLKRPVCRCRLFRPRVLRCPSQRVRRERRGSLCPVRRPCAKRGRLRRSAGRSPAR